MAPTSLRSRHLIATAGQAVRVLFPFVATALLGACTALPSRTPLISDRPGFSESSAIVEAGHTQVESGQRFARAGNVRSSASGEVVVRQGLAPWAELRFAANSYRRQWTGALEQDGFEDASVGAKLKLADGPAGPSWRPAVSLLAQSTVPTGTDLFRSVRAQPALGLLADWALRDRLGFSGNVVVARPFDGVRSFTEVAAIGALEIALHPRVGGFVEAYTIAGQGPSWLATRYLDGGLLFPLGPDLQLDVHGGWQPSAGARDLFFGVGVAVRR